MLTEEKHSKLSVKQLAYDKSFEASTMVDFEFMECDVDGNLYASINAYENEQEGPFKSVFIADLSEKQTLELYFFLKANLAKKYGSIL